LFLAPHFLETERSLETDGSMHRKNGRFQAWTVTKGFSQIPGKDIQENHSPVIKDTTFHTILVLKILLKLHAGQFDIETAFLYGNLEEEGWSYQMDTLTTFKNYKLMVKQKITETSHCLEVKKAIYGLVQAVRQWWKKFISDILQIGYKPSQADPCLFFNEGRHGKAKSFIIIYVDDGGILSDEETIQEVLKEIGKTFKHL
jgi:hypothetical protein